MAGENSSGFPAVSSSQDDLFPPEFNFLWRSLSETALNTVNVNFDMLDNFIVNQDSNQQPMVLDEAGAHEQVQTEDNLAGASSFADPLSTQIPVVGTNFQSSALPASETWPGRYNFTVSFNPQVKSTKGVAWTYSPLIDKLYVGKDVPCPVNFSANTKLPSNVYVRVMALFASPEQVSEIVTRCVNHSMEEIKNGVKEAEHLIRCESATATYHTDAAGRHSVLVPFENPAAGQQYSTYIYKFACFQSCSGGPNRRPLMLIFTLEMDQQVIGRRKLDVKICACPGRDRKSEEGNLKTEDGVPVPKSCKRESSDIGALSDIMEFTKQICGPVSKKKKICENKRKWTIERKLRLLGMWRLLGTLPYTPDVGQYQGCIQTERVDDEHTYVFLTTVKRALDVFKQRRLPEAAGSLSEHKQRVKNEKED